MLNLLSGGTMINQTNKIMLTKQKLYYKNSLNYLLKEYVRDG